MSTAIAARRGRPPRAPVLVLQSLLTRPIRWKDLHQQLHLPKATVTATLRRLEEQGTVRASFRQGIVRWQLTLRGRYGAITELVHRGALTPELRNEFLTATNTAGFAITLSELHPDAWRQLVRRVAERMQLESPINAKDELEDRLDAQVTKSRPAIQHIWPQLVRSAAIGAAIPLATLVVLRSLHPTGSSPYREAQLRRMLTTTARDLLQVQEEAWLALLDEGRLLAAPAGS